MQLPKSGTGWWPPLWPTLASLSRPAFSQSRPDFRMAWFGRDELSPCLGNSATHTHTHTHTHTQVLARPTDHAGEVIVRTRPGFDLDKTIFKTLPMGAKGVFPRAIVTHRWGAALDRFTDAHPLQRHCGRKGWVNRRRLDVRSMRTLASIVQYGEHWQCSLVLSVAS